MMRVDTRRSIGTGAGWKRLAFPAGGSERNPRSRRRVDRALASGRRGDYAGGAVRAWQSSPFSLGFQIPCLPVPESRYY